MTDASPQRRSKRQRVPNKKYSNDGLEVLNAVLSSDSEDEEILQQQLLKDDSEDFPIDQIGEEEDGDSDDDEESLAKEVSEGSEILTPVEGNEDAQSYASSDPGSPNAPRASRRRIKIRLPPAANCRSRGMPENIWRKDVAQDMISLFTGGSEEDVSHFINSKTQWAADPILPHRSHLRYGVSHTHEKRQMESTVGWDWYYDQGGRELFAEKQNVQRLTSDEATKYTYPAVSDKEVLMGPYGRQTKFILSPLQSLELDQAWSSTEDSPKRRRHGWMLNVSSRVRCLEWAPNHNSSMQYLALVTAPLAKTQHSFTTPPAFTPMSGPSAIQLWAVPTSRTTEEDVDKPALQLVLCTDWGEIRQLKWCPVPREFRESATTEASNTSLLSCGLLAVVFSDGKVRVLDIQLEGEVGLSTPYKVQKFTRAAFEAAPPHGSLSTCLTWLSATDVAIGDSSGHLTVYDIYPETKADDINTSPANVHQDETIDHQKAPTPWLTVALHSTYMLALTSAYPTHPSLIISSSLSGYVRVTSIRAPMTDYVLSLRGYTPPSALIYSDSLLSALWAEEGNETAKLSGLRCAYASIACQSLPSTPGPGSQNVDVGKCHSSLATGCSDGSVIVSNPQCKVFGYPKTLAYQLCLFKHDWRPTVGTKEAEDQQRQGISRVTEGYLPQRIFIGPKHTDFVHGKDKNIPITTIYEEETAVTALAWNPNVHCGGWLAVGWGSGLVRIQDVALD